MKYFLDFTCLASGQAFTSSSNSSIDQHYFEFAGELFHRTLRLSLSNISECLRLERGQEHLYAFYMKLGLSLFLDSD